MLSIIKSDIILKRSSSDIRIGVVSITEGVVKNGSTVDRINGLRVTWCDIPTEWPSVVIGVVKGPGSGVEVEKKVGEVISSGSTDSVVVSKFNLRWKGRAGLILKKELIN